MIAPLALALLAHQDAPPAPELLPDAPDGWTFERLGLPLEFAPDLGLSGFEELRFAPGMFDSGSDSYWSYAFALRLDGEHRVDRGFVEGFLTGYYDGLIRAVAGGRGLELPEGFFGLELSPTADGWRATLELVDAFVTGEPFTLHLELDAHALLGNTELFAIASPEPRDAGVWEDLEGIRATWLSTRPAPVLLNHVYAVVDEATYEALVACEVLAERFALVEERTTRRVDGAYTGLYFYGEETYVELLRPGGPRGLVPGEFGLALGVERTDAIDALAQRLAECGVTTFPGDVPREREGESLPWFRILGSSRAHAESRLQLFTMEYASGFAEAWSPRSEGTAPGAPSLARGEVLDAYARGLSGRAHREAALFRDVIALTLEVDDAEAEALLTHARAFCWNVEQREDARHVLRPPGLVITLITDDDPAGLLAIRMETARSDEPLDLERGSARLTLDSQAAELRLRP